MDDMRNIKFNRPLELKKLEAVFRTYPEIDAVYLFGSHARGQANQHSDIDLAIVPGSGDIRRKHLDILTDLVRVGYSDVDLVFLDCTDIVLKYEAIRDNVLVYARDEFDSGAYCSLIIRQYLDFQPYLKLQREAYKRSVVNG
jgi:predicted nucleotidyltransferase